MRSVNLVQHRTVVRHSCPHNLHGRHQTNSRKIPQFRSSLACTSVQSNYVDAGPKTPEPDYTQLDSHPLNRLVMALFRMKMVSAIGEDSRFQGFAAIIDLTRTLNRKFSAPGATQAATRKILKSLFPFWLPSAFKVMFSQPFREFSCRLNAFATFVTCQWLMGPCAVNDVEIDGGAIGVGHGVLVERCRYLEQAGCAAVCTNSCKLPTQEFFAKDMGLPLTMTPNYEDYSCQFTFGKTPVPIAEDAAFKTACFSQCPTKLRQREAAACHNISAPS